MAALTDHERQQIIDLLHEGLSRNDIARRTGRGTSTVTRIAKSIGHDFLTASDERTQASLARAHDASRAFSAERRALAAARNQELLEELQEHMFDDQVRPMVVGDGFGGASVVKVKVPPDHRALSDMAKALHTLNRAILDTSKHDVKPDEGSERSMLVELVDGLRSTS